MPERFWVRWARCRGQPLAPNDSGKPDERASCHFGPWERCLTVTPRSDLAVRPTVQRCERDLTVTPRSDLAVPVAHAIYHHPAHGHITQTVNVNVNGGPGGHIGGPAAGQIEASTPTDARVGVGTTAVPSWAPPGVPSYSPPMITVNRAGDALHAARMGAANAIRSAAEQMIGHIERPETRLAIEANRDKACAALLLAASQSDIMRVVQAATDTFSELMTHG